MTKFKLALVGTVFCGGLFVLPVSGAMAAPAASIGNAATAVNSKIVPAHYYRYHHHYRHCWWRHGYRHCRW